MSNAIINTGKALLKQFLPAVFWRRKFQRLARVSADEELALVPHLCDKARTSLDVGASLGLFTVHMLSSSRDVIAFEPRPRAAADLRSMFRAAGAPVQVEEVALSDKPGTTRMRLLVEDLGRSTIEPANQLVDEDGSPCEEINVQTKRLDDYQLKEIGFVKIDVEGHELSVLKGALETIDSNRPIFLIESENRHRANCVNELSKFFARLEYSGFFILHGSAQRMDLFSQENHQNPSNISGWKHSWQKQGVYINNFFFVPKDKLDNFATALETCKTGRSGAHPV